MVGGSAALTLSRAPLSPAGRCRAARQPSLALKTRAAPRPALALQPPKVFARLGRTPLGEVPDGPMSFVVADSWNFPVSEADHLGARPGRRGVSTKGGPLEGIVVRACQTGAAVNGSSGGGQRRWWAAERPGPWRCRPPLSSLPSSLPFSLPSSTCPCSLQGVSPLPHQPGPLQDLRHVRHQASGCRRQRCGWRARPPPARRLQGAGRAGRVGSALETQVECWLSAAA